MSETSNPNGAARSSLILLVVSLLAGLGMAFATAATIVSTSGPADSSAVIEGEQQPVAPEVLLNYGG